MSKVIPLPALYFPTTGAKTAATPKRNRFKQVLNALSWSTYHQRVRTQQNVTERITPPSISLPVPTMPSPRTTTSIIPPEPQLEHPSPIRPRAEPSKQRILTPVGEVGALDHFPDISAWYVIVQHLIILQTHRPRHQPTGRLSMNKSTVLSVRESLSEQICH